MHRIVNAKMTTLLALVIFVVMLFADSDIFDLVHRDYDFVVRISKGGSWYSEIQKVPFFSFILNRKGLGFEDSFLRILEDMRYKTGVQPSIVQEAISNDVLFASKGIEVDLNNLISFDLNYYFDFIKTMASNSFFAFQTKSPENLVKAIAFLLSVNYKAVGNNQYILDDSLYCGFSGKYLVVAGSKQALELALKTFVTPDMQLSRTAKVFERLKAGTFFASGYSKPNVIKFSIPGVSKLDTSDSEYIVFYSSVSAGNMSITFEQKNRKETNTKKIAETMGNIPMAWNYYLSIPSSNIQDILETVKQWFQGSLPDITRILDFVTSLSKASSNVYNVGRLETNDFLIIFDDASSKDLEKNISKLGGKYDSQKQEWTMTFHGIKLSAYSINNRVYFGTIERSKYEQYDRTRSRLKDVPLYFDFSKIGSYDFKLLLDIGDIIKTTTGFNVSSKMLFWRYSSGYFTYYKILIS